MKSSSPEEKEKPRAVDSKIKPVLKIVLWCVVAIVIVVTLDRFIVWLDNRNNIVIGHVIPEDGMDVVEELPIPSEKLYMTAYGEINKEMLQEELKKTVVQIRADIVSEAEGTDYTINGSGVILEITEAYIDIATAAHVVELTAEPEVYFCDGSHVNGIVLAYGKQSDVAFVRIEISALPDGIGEQVQEAKCCTIEEYNELVLSSEVFCVGSVSKVADTVVRGALVEKDRFVPLFQNDMLIGDTAVDGGMSGGGTYNDKGKLLGIVVGTADSESASVAITDVMAEYRSIEQ